MKDKKYLKEFITHVTRNDYKKANAALAAVVNEKIKQRIVAANKELAKSN